MSLFHHEITSTAWVPPNLLWLLYFSFSLAFCFFYMGMPCFGGVERRLTQLLSPSTVYPFGQFYKHSHSWWASQHHSHSINKAIAAHPDSWSMKFSKSPSCNWLHDLHSSAFGALIIDHRTVSTLLFSHLWILTSLYPETNTKLTHQFCFKL